MLEFITYKKLDVDSEDPSWLVIYCRKEVDIHELGFTQVVLFDTCVQVDFSTTLITDEDDQVEFNFEVAQYLVEQEELIMGEDGDYYLPEGE